MLALALPLLAAMASEATPPARPEPASRPVPDVLYRALHGDAEPVAAVELMASPGRFVGHAVTTSGRLERARREQTLFELVEGKLRLSLRLEPQVAAIVAENASFWLGRLMEVEGFFYRAAADGDYGLRAWLVWPADVLPSALPPASSVPLISLEELVYGQGRFDGRLVRVHGSYRGLNSERDLPESTRKGARDWVLKEGYFAVWVAEGRTGGGRREPEPERGAFAKDVALDVIGLPSTAKGVVRLAAREVATRWEGPMPVVARALTTGDDGWAAVPPRVSFAYPVEGERLRAKGQMVVQFNKPMDPTRFESRVRVRYQRGGQALTPPRLTLDYRDTHRDLLMTHVLVVTPEPPPPAGCRVSLELLEGIIDVNGRALALPEQPLQFRSER